MGVSDCTTILGNRKGEQQGYNFDECCKKERSANGKIRYSPGEIADKMDNGDIFDAYLENAPLVIEVIRVNKGNEIIFRENNDRNFEQDFMKIIYSNKKQVKIFSCFACCDEWSFIPLEDDQFEKLPHEFEYYNYCDSGTFKFNNDHESWVEGIKQLSPKMLFSDFDTNNEEIWMRVWYAEIYKGIIKTDKFTPTLLSDECLVWTAGELNITDTKSYTRRELFEKVREKILVRYFD